MKRIAAMLACAGALSMNAAHAQADLAQAKNCLACHAVDSKKIGPAYKDVAARYAGDQGAEDKLVQKVIKGSAGVWGPVPMPPNPQVSEAEARKLVRWIRGQKQ